MTNLQSMSALILWNKKDCESDEHIPQWAGGKKAAKKINFHIRPSWLVNLWKVAKLIFQIYIILNFYIIDRILSRPEIWSSPHNKQCLFPTTDTWQLRQSTICVAAAWWFFVPDWNTRITVIVVSWSAFDTQFSTSPNYQITTTNKSSKTTSLMSTECVMWVSCYTSYYSS